MNQRNDKRIFANGNAKVKGNTISKSSTIATTNNNNNNNGNIISISKNGVSIHVLNTAANKNKLSSPQEILRHRLIETDGYEARRVDKVMEQMWEKELPFDDYEFVLRCLEVGFSDSPPLLAEDISLSSTTPSTSPSTPAYSNAHSNAYAPTTLVVVSGRAAATMLTGTTSIFKSNEKDVGTEVTEVQSSLRSHATDGVASVSDTDSVQAATKNGEGYNLQGR